MSKKSFSSSLFEPLRVGVAAALLPAVALAATSPVPVSPGGAAASPIGAVCPTFSWGGVPGARSYELVVYRVGDENEEPREQLRQRLPAATYSWTPSLARCLERGERYAWSVRAAGGAGPGAWSSPNLFEIAAGPSASELERALEVVRLHLAGSGAVTEQRPAPPASDPEPTEENGAARQTAKRPGSSPFRGRLDNEVEIVDHRIRIDGNDVVTTETDNDTLGGLLCVSGQVPKRHLVSGDWICAPDRLDGIVCPEGQIVRRIGGSWSCDLDRWNGYEVVQGPDELCGPLSTCSVSVACPAGKVVIGGGAASHQDGTRLASSFPVAATATWHVTIRNTLVANSRGFTPYAVCSGGTGGF